MDILSFSGLARSEWEAIEAPMRSERAQKFARSLLEDIALQFDIEPGQLADDPMLYIKMTTLFQTCGNEPWVIRQRKLLENNLIYDDPDNRRARCKTLRQWFELNSVNQTGEWRQRTFPISIVFHEESEALTRLEGIETRDRASDGAQIAPRSEALTRLKGIETLGKYVNVEDIIKVAKGLGFEVVPKTTKTKEDCICEYVRNRGRYWRPCEYCVEQHRIEKFGPGYVIMNYKSPGSIRNLRGGQHIIIRTSGFWEWFYCDNRSHSKKGDGEGAGALLCEITTMRRIYNY